MDKKKIEQILIPVLCLIFIIYFGDMLKKMGLFGGRRIAPTPQAALKQSEAVLEAGKTSAVRSAKLPIEDLTWGRDPFVPYELTIEEASSIENLHLMGVTWSSDAKKYCAVINDELVTAGSVIGSFTVVDIKKDRVTVKDEKGDEHELSIKEEF